MEQLAEFICEFDDILVEIALNETIHSTRVKIGKKKDNARIQDNLGMTTLTNDSFDLDRCAYCKHRFVIPTGMDCDEINLYNQNF